MTYLLPYKIIRNTRKIVYRLLKMSNCIKNDLGFIDSKSFELKSWSRFCDPFFAFSREKTAKPSPVILIPFPFPTFNSKIYQ